MAPRQVIVRYGLFRRAVGFALRHPYWLLGLLFVARLVEERGW